MARNRPDTGVILAAGGSGRRFGGPLPKQFITVRGKTILQWSLELFTPLSAVREIVVVSPQAYMARVRKIVAGTRAERPVVVVPGGKERQDSVWEGLQQFTREVKVVLVHDAVRPVVSRRVILDVIRQARLGRAALPAVPVRETIKRGTGGVATLTIDRSDLWVAHTPQGFHLDLLVRAHRAARKGRIRVTDDAALVERLGIPVTVVKDSVRNIKVTSREDMHAARMWLK